MSLFHDNMTPEQIAWVQKKRRKRLADIDQLPPEIRALVHEYGYNVVRAFLDCGVTQPNRIRHLVETVLDDFSPTRGSRSAQGRRVSSENMAWKMAE